MRPARPRRRLPAVLAITLLSTGLLNGSAPTAGHAAADTVSAADATAASPHPPLEGADGAVRSWLQEANYLRGFWNLPVPQLVEDPELSRRNALHAAYDSRNNSCGHHEEPGNPHYTADGDYAAKHSVLWCGPVRSASAVDGWVRTPFHGEQVLNPRLTTTGFSDAEQRSGMDTLTHRRAGPPVSAPMSWPNGSEFPLRQWWGSEIPDPLESMCPVSYVERNREVTTGQPLFAILPEADRFTEPSEVRFGLADGTQLPYCLLPYKNLFMSTAIIMPLDPLRPGTRYLASYTAGASTARWDFTTSRERTTSTLDGPESLGFGKALELVGALRSTENTRVSRFSSDQEPPLPGQAVTLLADGQVAATAQTDDDGEFTFTLPYRKSTWTVQYGGTSAYAPTTSDPFVTAFDPTPLDTTLRLSASPAPATFGSSVKVSARLISHDPEDASTSAVVGQPVALQAQQADGTWSTVTTATTDSAGSVAMVRPGDRSRRYRAAYAGKPGQYGSSSVIGHAPVELRLSGLGVARTSSSSTTWTGTAAPGGNRVVTLQYRSGVNADWSTLARARSDGAGRFRILAPLRRGSWEYRIAVAGTPDAYVGATGPARRLAG